MPSIKSRLNLELTLPPVPQVLTPFLPEGCPETECDLTAKTLAAILDGLSKTLVYCCIFESSPLPSDLPPQVKEEVQKNHALSSAAECFLFLLAGDVLLGATSICRAFDIVTKNELPDIHQFVEDCGFYALMNINTFGGDMWNHLFDKLQHHGRRQDVLLSIATYLRFEKQDQSIATDISEIISQLQQITLSTDDLAATMAYRLLKEDAYPILNQGGTLPIEELSSRSNWYIAFRDLAHSASRTQNFYTRAQNALLEFGRLLHQFRRVSDLAVYRKELDGMGMSQAVQVLDQIIANTDRYPVQLESLNSADSLRDGTKAKEYAAMLKGKVNGNVASICLVLTESKEVPTTYKKRPDVDAVRHLTDMFKLPRDQWVLETLTCEPTCFVVKQTTPDGAMLRVSVFVSDKEKEFQITVYPCVIFEQDFVDAIQDIRNLDSYATREYLESAKKAVETVAKLARPATTRA